MRWQRIIFLAAIVAASACGVSKKDIKTAKHSLFDTDFAVVYGAALEATREQYPNLEDAPGRGAIKTAWHQVANNNGDDVTQQKVVGAGAGNTIGPNNGVPGTASGGLPTRLSYKRYFIRFDVTIAGGRPWRLKVVGHAAEWEPGTAQPTELHGIARPSWLEGRSDSLLVAIYKKVQKFAVPMKDDGGADEEDTGVKKSDPQAFHDVPPAAAKRLAALKDALDGRNYAALRSQLADDVLWSLGGGAGADTAVAMWQADTEPLDLMSKALAGGCFGDDKKVTCPPGPPLPGIYQLILEARPEGWKVTSFVKGE
ncbi:MAG TPA: hypothetical protein VFP84_28825 [Kofleriaceae bacterium]|nr:hypothetical protein [Kofleriaceae bacterium]